MPTRVRHSLKSFAKNVLPREPHAPKDAESSKFYANKNMALAQIFARNVTQRETQSPKVSESSELDANEGTALAQIFRAEARPND